MSVFICDKNTLTFPDKFLAVFQHILIPRNTNN